MKKILIAVMAIGLSPFFQTAAGQQNQFMPMAGLGVLPVYHATLELKWNEKIILFDPSVDDQLIKKMKKPDIVFLTDIHPDHLNVDNMIKLGLAGIPIVAPQAVADKLTADLKRNLIIIGNGEKKEWNGIRFEAIPMYNLTAERKAFHTKGRGNGYVLTLGDKRVYISGDTEDIPEMRSLKSIDLAFICMNLPYTMTVEQAAAAVAAFRPKIVVPYHYKGSSGLSDTRKFKTLVGQKAPAVTVKLLNFYP